MITLISTEFRPVETILPVSRSLSSTRSILVYDISDQETHLISVSLHTNKVAYLSHKYVYVLVELSVVDGRGRLYSSITADEFIEVIEECNDDSILNLAGITSHEVYTDIGQILRS